MDNIERHFNNRTSQWIQFLTDFVRKCVTYFETIFLLSPNKSGIFSPNMDFLPDPDFFYQNSLTPKNILTSLIFIPSLCPLISTFRQPPLRVCPLNDEESETAESSENELSSKSNTYVIIKSKFLKVSWYNSNLNNSKLQFRI